MFFSNFACFWNLWLSFERTILTLSVSKNHPCEVVLHSVIHYRESNLRENNSVHNGILVRQNVALSFKMMFTNNNDYIRKHLYWIKIGGWENISIKLSEFSIYKCVYIYTQRECTFYIHVYIWVYMCMYNRNTHTEKSLEDNQYKNIIIVFFWAVLDLCLSTHF